jgi:hypothetical protein
MPRVPNHLVGVFNPFNARNLGVDSPQNDTRKNHHGKEGSKISGAKFVSECGGGHFMRSSWKKL